MDVEIEESRLVSIHSNRMIWNYSSSFRHTNSRGPCKMMSDDCKIRSIDFYRNTGIRISLPLIAEALFTCY